jgi:hypothetical protein
MPDVAPERLLAVFGVCVVVAVVVSAGTTSAAFSPFNGNWEGASGLQAVAAEADVESDVALTTDAYDSVRPLGTVAVVVSPDRRYTDAEAAAVERFVRRGGTLLVAEDFGPHSNALLASLGARSRVDGRLVTDDAVYYRSPTMPVARPDAASRLLVGVDTFTLNHGSYVRPDGASVLVASSDYAVVRNDIGNPVGTSLGPYPFVTVEPLGDGSVVVVSDSSALINAMLDRPGNAAFVENVFARHDRVLLDYSHSADVPPLEQALAVVASVPLLQAGLGVVTLLVVGLVATRVGRRSRGRPAAAASTSPPSGHEDVPRTHAGVDHETLVSHLRATHPEWDPERTDRLARAVRALSGTAPDDD